jgi:hypothetical protein
MAHLVKQRHYTETNTVRAEEHNRKKRIADGEAEPRTDHATIQANQDQPATHRSHRASEVALMAVACKLC